MDRPRFPPWLGVAVAVFSVSFAAPLFRLADAPPVTASFWRLAFAVLLLLPFSRPAWRTWADYTPREWLLTAAAGAALGLHFALWVTSLFWTSVAAATTLVTLQAVFVALGGAWLGDRLGGRGWTGVAIAVVGAAIITLAHAEGAAAAEAAGPGAPSLALRGDALALAAGVASAVYMLIGRRLRATRDLVAYVTPVYAAAAVVLAIAAPLVDQPLTAGVGTTSFVWFVLLAAVPMLGGHTMANWTIRYLPAHVVATWILLEPVGAALLAWPLLGEVPPWSVAVGAATVVAGAALTVRGRVVADEPPG